MSFDIWSTISVVANAVKSTFEALTSIIDFFRRFKKNPRFDHSNIHMPLYFTGRDDCLKIIDEELKSHQIAYLYGAPGIGKTALADVYAIKNRHKYTYIRKINASEEATIEDGFCNIAQYLGRRKKGNQKVRAGDAYDNLPKNEKALLIFDNLFDKKLLDRYTRPIDSIIQYIIVAGCLMNHRQIKVEPLSPENSIKYLANVTKKFGSLGDLRKSMSAALSDAFSNRKKAEFIKAEFIIKEIGGNPLALSHIAHYFIKHPNTYVEDYIENFKDHLANDSIVPYHQTSSLVTYQISLEKADKDIVDPSKSVGAKFIICLSSFFCNDTIPRTIFMNAYELNQSTELSIDGSNELDPFGFSSTFSQSKEMYERKIREAISTLDSYSLIKWDSDLNVFSMSRIAQLAVQNLVNKNEARWAVFALMILEMDFPMVNDESYAQCRKMHRHVDSILKHVKRVFLCNDVAYNYMHSDIERIFVPKYASLLKKYALYFYNNDEYKKCLEIRRDLIDFCKKYYGPISFESAKSYDNLALVYRTLGEVSEADEAYEISIKILRKIDRDELRLIEVLANYAWWYANSKRIDKAEIMYSDLLPLCKNDREKDSPIFAQILFDYGTFCRQTKRPYETIDYYSKAIRKFSTHYGENSSETARFKDGLAWQYAILERFDDAKKIYEEILKIREALKPSVPDDIATTLIDLADVLRKMHPYQVNAISSHGRHWRLRFWCCRPDKDRNQQKADENFRRAITLLRHRHEKPNPYLARALFRFGKSYAESGRYRQGRERCVEALKMLKDMCLKENVKETKDMQVIADYIEQIDANQHWLWGRFLRLLS